MSFILYDNPEAFKGPIPTPVYARLAATVPNIIGAKYMSLTPKYRVDIEAVQGKMRLLPLELDWFMAHMLFPEQVLAGYINAGPTRHPYHVMPSAYIEGARESRRRWRQVTQEVANVSKSAINR